MGFGIIAVRSQKVSLVEMDVLRLSSKKDPYQRLQLIYNKVRELLLRYEPHEFAIEAPFFGKNVQSMLKLGRAQGVAIAAAMQSGIPVTEYSPRRIKQSITGNGNAGKLQVLKMLQRIIVFEEPRYFDATDALAVAVCHHFSGGRIGPESEVPARKAKKPADWNDFVANNPGRVGGK